MLRAPIADPRGGAQVAAAEEFEHEQALQIFQQNFEHSLDQLIAAIRNQYKVNGEGHGYRSRSIRATQRCSRRSRA